MKTIAMGGGGMPSWYWVVAGALFVTELVLGIGIIGIPIGLTVAPAILLTRNRLRERMRRSAVFLGLALATFGWLVLNTRIAKSNAALVILACKQFRAERNRYPSDLHELIPSPLPSLPAARNTLAGRKFVYDKNRPALCFAAMFHGVFCYDFQADKWVAKD